MKATKNRVKNNILIFNEETTDAKGHQIADLIINVLCCSKMPTSQI